MPDLKLYGDRLALTDEDPGLYGVDPADGVKVGRVVAVGRGRLNDHSARVDVPHKAGEVVIYCDDNAVSLSVDGVKLYVVSSCDLLLEAPPAREPEPETEAEPEAEPEADDAPPAETV